MAANAEQRSFLIFFMIIFAWTSACFSLEGYTVIHTHPDPATNLQFKLFPMWNPWHYRKKQEQLLLTQMKGLIKQHAYSGLLTVSSSILQEQKLNAQLKYTVMVWPSAERSGWCFKPQAWYIKPFPWGNTKFCLFRENFTCCQRAHQFNKRLLQSAAMLNQTQGYSRWISFKIQLSLFPTGEDMRKSAALSKGATSWRIPTQYWSYADHALMQRCSLRSQLFSPIQATWASFPQQQQKQHLKTHSGRRKTVSAGSTA